MVKHLAAGTRSVQLHIIKAQVRRFLRYARASPDLLFVVAAIGCVNGGYAIDEMAAMFHPRDLPPNVVLNSAFGAYWASKKAAHTMDVLRAEGESDVRGTQSS